MRWSGERAERFVREHGFEPLEPFPGGVDTPWLRRCQDCGQQVRRTITNVRAKKGCRFCRGVAVDPVAATALMRAKGLDPTMPYPGANNPWPSRCRRHGHEISPSYSSVKAGHGCRHSAGQVLDPELADQQMCEAGLTPLEPFRCVDRAWASRCDACGARVSPSLSSVRAGHGCRFCGFEKIRTAKLLPTEAMVTIMRRANLEPEVSYPGANKPWRARCTDCGRITNTPLCTVRDGGRCPFCTRRVVDPTYAVREWERAGLRPLVPYPGQGVPWPSICVACGREVSPTLANIRRAQGGCAWCARRRVDPAGAARTMIGLGFEPLVPYPGAAAPWPSRCLGCGEKVAPRWNFVTRGVGCRYCRARGYNFTTAAVVYVMTHYGEGAVKIGVANIGNRTDRITRHRLRGWELCGTRRLDSGEAAWMIEQSVLAELRQARALPHYMSPELMPQGGWTETFDEDLVSAVEMMLLVDHEIHRIAASGPRRPELPSEAVSGGPPTPGVDLPGDRPNAGELSVP